MKKLFLYVFLSLMFCNISFAEQIEISCPISNISSNITLPDVVRFKEKTIKLLVDTDEMKRQASFIEKQLGKETIETIRGAQNKVGSKRIFADDKPTKKAKALYKRMIDKDKGYIDIYQFGGGMFK